MNRFRKIVVGLALMPHEDRLTDGSALALDQAAALAAGGESRLVLVHSDAQDEVWDEDEQRYASARDPAHPRTALDRALEALRDHGLDARLEIRHEKAWIAITRLVLNESSDLVVVGKRNAPFLQGPLLGSVATKLVRKCPCAVWVVKPGGAVVPRVVLTGTDLTPVGDLALTVASELACEWGAVLHVVHSFQLSMAVQLGRGESRESFVARTESAARAHVEEVLERGPRPEHVHLHVGLSSPSHAMLAGAAGLHPDLIVMGTLSRGGVPGVLVGNTAERLLARLDCSLLTVKPDDFVCPLARV